MKVRYIFILTGAKQSSILGSLKVSNKYEGRFTEVSSSNTVTAGGLGP